LGHFGDYRRAKHSACGRRGAAMVVNHS
jgi:hypothetical protein